MPIPDFDNNHVLPPFVGRPTNSQDISPFRSDILEVCKKFSTSDQRREILIKLIEFRENIIKNGICSGFQWLNGSFMQNIEISEKRAPKDIDVVTFYQTSDRSIEVQISQVFPEFFLASLAKENYKIDHYTYNILDQNRERTVAMTHYWSQLFSHTRDERWKGIIRIELNTSDLDIEALKFLKEKK